MKVLTSENRQKVYKLYCWTLLFRLRNQWLTIYRSFQLFMRKKSSRQFNKIVSACSPELFALETFSSVCLHLMWRRPVGHIEVPERFFCLISTRSGHLQRYKGRKFLVFNCYSQWRKLICKRFKFRSAVFEYLSYIHNSILAIDW